MKNKIIIILIFLFFSSYLKAENLLIQSKKISLEKKSEISIFEDAAEALGSCSLIIIKKINCCLIGEIEVIIFNRYKIITTLEEEF